MIVIDNDIIATRTCVFSTTSPNKLMQARQFSVYYQPSKLLYSVEQLGTTLYVYNLYSFLSGAVPRQVLAVASAPWKSIAIHVDANFVYLLRINYPFAIIDKYNRLTLTYNSQINLPDNAVSQGNIIHDCCGTGFIITDMRAISVTNGNIEIFTWFNAISYNPLLDVCLVRDKQKITDYYIAHNFLNGQRRFVRLTFSNNSYQYNLELVPSNTQILLKMWTQPGFFDSLFYKHNPLQMNSERGKIKIFAYNEISETTADVVPLER